MRFSLITSTPTEMYAFNPFINTPAVAPLTMEAFVAPADFDPDAQELNIVKAFAAYPNVNKKYIFSVGTSTTTVLPAVAGRTYAYAENGGAYTTIVSGTVTWTVGSTKRNVVVIDSASSVIANIPVGGVWGYASDKVHSFYSSNNTFLIYIHCQKVSCITSIGNYAFNNCTGLINITIPNSVTSIGNYAFNGCINAIFNNNNLVLSNIETLSGSAFDSCYKLKNVDLSASTLTELGYTQGITFGVFHNCTGLISILLPNTLIRFIEAFNGCTGLTSITIPNSVTSIGNAAFNDCTGLINITIPNSVTSIGNAAFNGCTGLINITIPNSVTSIGNVAFNGCTGLTSVINTRIIPQTGLTATTFFGVNKTIPLHVPVGSLAAYQATQYWNEFTNIIADL